jgi:lipoyl-dependent peroxiredoxin subunit C
MLTVGDRIPEFRLKSLVSLDHGKEFEVLSDRSYPDKWLVLFSWPMDFTFICPTEIVEFGRRTADFKKLGAQVLGFSGDTEYVHLAWRRENADLRDLPFPMLADTKRELSVALGVLHPEDGVPLRATFIVDPAGIIRFASANDLAVGRSVDEVLRVLEALQTGQLCPVNWKQGEATLGAA